MFRIFMALIACWITFVHGGMADAANGAISGRVSTSAKGVTIFRGVRVFIPGTSYISFTDDSGNFFINNVSPGTHELFAGHVNTTDYLGTLGEARLQGVVVQPGRTTTINPVLVPVIPKLLKVEPRVIDRDTPIRIQGEKFSKERSYYPCEMNFGGHVVSQHHYQWQDPRNLTISEAGVSELRKKFPEGKVQLLAYCFGAWSNPVEVEFRKTPIAASPPPAQAGTPAGGSKPANPAVTSVRTTGVFTPATAKPGDTVTLSGKAKPGSFMSVYINGQTHVGVAQVDQAGRYSLAFKVPSSARPGTADVAAGCDTCGNGWNSFNGLTINGPASAGTPVRSGGRGAGSRAGGNVLP